MRSLSLLAASLSSLYSMLDPTSVAQHFAFYELYPTSFEGRQALKTAWNLLSGPSGEEMLLFQADFKPLIGLVNRWDDKQPILPNEQIEMIQKLAQHLANREKKGFGLWSEQEILKLPDHEIDLSRGMLLAEMGESRKEEILSYEASLDLMALQIRAHLSEEATDLEKLRAISDFVFSEMRFRFPPHSLHAKDIDVYTFLPSVLDGRRGVCLGVSILYLCLAQRLGVELQAVTPPGHIYVRYPLENGEYLNIETTARGIDVPSERYLNIETKKLQVRTIKEVIGLAFMNQAATFWHRKEPKKAIALYEKAKPYVGEDYLLNTFLGFQYLFAGEKEKGKALLEKVNGVVPDHAISADSAVADYLNNLADVEALNAVFSEVDEKRSSIEEKQEKLLDITRRYPHFKQGWFHLAVTWLQLGREKEALPILETYIQKNPNDATALYYLAAIHYQRRNFNAAWRYVDQAYSLLAKHNHHPHALKQLKIALMRACPKPLKESL